jgi:hypothetical protein
MSSFTLPNTRRTAHLLQNALNGVVEQQAVAVRCAQLVDQLAPPPVCDELVEPLWVTTPEHPKELGGIKALLGQFLQENKSNER